MIKYLFDYVVLILIFLLTDVFLFVTQSSFNFLSYLPTITMAGNSAIAILIPYTYLIVRFLFIRKANNEDNTDYINIKNNLIIIVTSINIIATIIEAFIFNNTYTWSVYTILILFFMIILKTKQENQNNIMDKNIKEYFTNNKK